MVVMTIAQVVPILAYYIYRTASDSSSRKSGKNGASSFLAAGAYVVYICSELAVLWFSRVREYYADEFSAQATKDPGALGKALVKIGYGLAASGPNPAILKKLIPVATVEHSRPSISSINEPLST
jgi:heat shock protein HtpX